MKVLRLQRLLLVNEFITLALWLTGGLLLISQDMFKPLLIIVIIISLHTSKGLAQLTNVKWAKTALGVKDDWSRIVKSDSEGNVYILGEFLSKKLTVDGSVLINKADSTLNSDANLFLIKYSSDGKLLWAKVFESDGSFSTSRLDIGKSNSIIVTSSLSVGSYFSFGNKTYNNPKRYDIFFITQIDSDGNLLWSKAFYDLLPCSSTAGIKYDSDQNIVFGGITNSSTIIDESGNAIIRDSVRSVKLFLVKLSNNGQVIWTKLFGNNETQVFFFFCIDADNNIVINGVFTAPTFVLDSLSIRNRSIKDRFGNLYYDIFLAKLDSDGKALWLNSIYGKYDDASADKLMTDAKGNIYISGSYQSDTLFIKKDCYVIGGPYFQGKYDDLFYAKYDQSGNPLWIKSPTDRIKSNFFANLTVSKEGTLYIAGNYDNSKFQGGNLFPSFGYFDAFYIQCDTDGNILKSQPFGSTDWEWIGDLDLDQHGNLFITGNYGSEKLKLGDFELVNTSNDKSLDIFLIKVCPDSISSTGNPSAYRDLELVYLSDLHRMRISAMGEGDHGSLSIYNLSGQLIFSEDVQGNTEFVSVPELTAGVYLASLTTESGTITKRFVAR